MKIIHCNIWGDIEISDLAMTIIDTPVFQRLHDIKQNGFAYRVFPSVKTSRFEHSLGVYFMTRFLFQQVESSSSILINPRIKELVCIAGLVHDLGHGPFSHWMDNVLLQSIDTDWNHHENRSCDLFESVVNTYGISIRPDEITMIQQWIKGTSNEHWYDHLIHNRHTGFDMDKLDYLLRDVHAHGLSFRFDPYRILRNIKIIQNRLCFCSRIKDELQTMFLLRNRLRQHIYRHPKINQLEHQMYQILPKSLYVHILSIIYSKNIPRFLELTDSYLLHHMEPSTFYHRGPSVRDSSVSFSTTSTSTQQMVDEEWNKLKDSHFYSRNHADHSFTIQDWNFTSCFL